MNESPYYSGTRVQEPSNREINCFKNQKPLKFSTKIGTTFLYSLQLIKT